MAFVEDVNIKYQDTPNVDAFGRARVSQVTTQFDLKQFVGMIKEINPEYVSIGANSNPKVKLPEPSPEKLKALIKELRKFTEVKLKDNLKRLL